MFDDKLVVGQIGVEGGDDPVAVEKGRAFRLGPRLGHVGVAGEIEPEPSPALTVAG